MQPYKKYLTPQILAKINQLELHTKSVVEGTITGKHRSPYHGKSIEFVEHREYTPPDDIRYIDWKVYAKTDKFYIKQFEEETNLKAYILIDTSNSMSYKSNNLSKLEYAKYIAAALSYILLKQQDFVALISFDEKINQYIPPQGGMQHIRYLLDVIDKLQPASKTKISKCLSQLVEDIKRRGLIILISDLLDNQDEVINTLQYFKYKKHEVIVFNILDDTELNFSFTDRVLFIDLETNEKIETECNLIRKTYQERLTKFLQYYKSKLRANYIDYYLINTKTEPIDTLSACLLSRINRS